MLVPLPLPHLLPEHDRDLGIPFSRAAPPSAAPHLSPASDAGLFGALPDQARPVGRTALHFVTREAANAPSTSARDRFRLIADLLVRKGGSETVVDGATRAAVVVTL